ncbi:hypothetical protein E2C01_082096 [Portunus trituberculatus]|uniref:Uncharacterized protein n=1 Tax=Portunus trituberculatus TaxID=210409 RepID=A0A5B7IY56_PORTR|nr:hypothetical protein [Portunus trituberculatus]
MIYNTSFFLILSSLEIKTFSFPIYASRVCHFHIQVSNFLISNHDGHLYCDGWVVGGAMDSGGSSLMLAGGGRDDDGDELALPPTRAPGLQVTKSLLVMHKSQSLPSKYSRDTVLELDSGA